MTMEQLKKIKTIDLLLLVIEFIFLRFVRLFWVPPISDEENVDKKIVVVTGANAGLGKATAKKLAERGATVVLACRNLTEGQKALDDIKSKTGASKDKLVLMQLDLADLNSVQQFATALKKKFNSVDVLINNAGVIVTSRPSGVTSVTKEGFELHMGVNHLGHFLLTNLLLDVLKRGSSSRVVTVSSHLIFQANLKMNDLMMENTTDFGNGYIPYNNSKFANILFTSELAKRLEGTGVTSYAIAPGMVATNVFKNMSWKEQLFVKIKLVLFGVTADIGCESILLCALSKGVKDKSGKVFHYNKELTMANNILMDPESIKMAKELWEKSEKLVDLKQRMS